MVPAGSFLAGRDESSGGDTTTTTGGNVVDGAGDLGGSEDKLVEELSTSSSRCVLFLGLSSARRCLACETMSMTSWGSSLCVRVECAIASNSFYISRGLGMVSYHFPTGGLLTHSMPGSHR